MKAAFDRPIPKIPLNSKFTPSPIITRVVDGKTFKVVNAGDSIISAIEPENTDKATRVKRYSTLVPRN